MNEIVAALVGALLGASASFVIVGRFKNNEKKMFAYIFIVLFFLFFIHKNGYISPDEHQEVIDAYKSQRYK